MKPIRIELVDDPRWVAVWMLTAVCCATIVGISAWRWHEDQLERQAWEAQVAQAKKRAAELQAKANAPDPNRAKREAVEKLHQMDLNKVFDAVEQMVQPGVRLRSMDFDAAGNVLRLEYEMDSIKDAVSVTFALNAKYEHGPWQLESVSATGPKTGAPAQKFRGFWSAAVDKL